MEKLVTYFKNKFILTSFLFLIYMLFLDDVDIFTIINQKRKYYRLLEAKADVSNKLSQVRSQLNQLKYTSELESYARENKLFKKENEDIFIISNE
jgi:cell division protein DivIC